MGERIVDLELFKKQTLENKISIIKNSIFFTVLPEVLEFVINDSSFLEKLLSEIKTVKDYDWLPTEVQKLLYEKYKDNIINLYLNSLDNLYVFESANEMIKQELLTNYRAKVLKLYLDRILAFSIIGAKNFQKFPENIQNDLLKFYKNELATIFFNSMNFEQLSPDTQNKIIDFYYDDLTDELKFKIVSYIKDKKMQNKFFDDTDFFKYYISSISLKRNGDLLYYLVTIKDFDIFKKLYSNEEIFHKIMKENNGIIKNNYFSFSYAPDEVQEYILNDLKDKKNYQFQYQLLLEKSSENVRLKFLNALPNDIKGFILLLKNNTVNEEAKEKLISIVPRANYNNLLELLNLYPEYIDEDLLKRIINSSTLYAISSAVKKIELKENEKLISILTVELSQRIYDNPNILDLSCIDILSFLKLPEKEEEEILNNLDISTLLIQCKLEFIQRFLIKKINDNPDFLRNINDESLFALLYDRKSMKFLLSLKEYLSPELLVFISPELDDKLLTILMDNPKLATYVNSKQLAEELFNRFGTNEIVSNIPLNILMTCSNENQQIKEYCIKLLCVNDAHKFSYNLEVFYKGLSDSQKVKLITNTTAYVNLIEYYDASDNDTIKDLISKSIINNQDEIFKDDIYYRQIAKLDDDIILRLNDNNLIYIYSIKPSVGVEKEIVKRTKKNPYIFNDVICGEEAFENLFEEDKRKISTSLNDKINEIFKDNPELTELILKNDTILNYKIVEAYERGLLDNKEVYDSFMMLIKDNPYVVSTMNFDFLSIDFNLHDNGRFLRKITKYPEMQTRILNIKKNNQENFTLLSKLIGKFNSQDGKIFDRKLTIILNDLENNNYNFNRELNDQEIDSLLRYILINSNVLQFSKNPMNVKGIEILNYDNIIAERCDEAYKNSRNILEKKNLLFMKYFDITYEDALEFVRMYDNDLTDVNVNETALSYMECVKEISTFDNENEFDEFYYSYSPRYTINDLFIVENDYQKAYTEALLNSMFKGKGNIQVMEIDGEKIEVVIPDESFKMLVHSTNAYSNMPMIDNDFYKSWNLSKKTNNHGICTAFVSDKCLGFPPLKSGGGCIFGFTEFSTSSITNMAPYDLCSINSDYQLITGRPLIYSSPESIINMTRHTHNEFVLERTNLLDNDTANIQPNYVIITNEMDEEKKKNAVKASKEMNPPDGLPIVYIDFEYIINKNKGNILKEISIFEKNKNLDYLKNIINNYETIMCTCFSINKYDFIKPEVISGTLYKHVYECMLSNNYNDLNEIRKILENERAKFDLISDFSERAKYMHINYSEYISLIDNYFSNYKESEVISDEKQR